MRVVIEQDEREHMIMRAKEGVSRLLFDDGNDESDKLRKHLPLFVGGSPGYYMEGTLESDGNKMLFHGDIQEFDGSQFRIEFEAGKVCAVFVAWQD